MMTKMKNKKVVEKLVEKRHSRSGLKITAGKIKKKPVAVQRVSVVPVAGLDLHFLSMAKNSGSHQCLHWWLQVSTGHLRL